MSKKNNQIKTPDEESLQARVEDWIAREIEARCYVKEEGGWLDLRKLLEDGVEVKIRKYEDCLAFVHFRQWRKKAQ